MNLKSYSPKETKKLAQGLALEINNYHKKALVLALVGDLGAGKTTFTQGLAKALGAKTEALSPTFVLMRKHKLEAKHYRALYHIDAYRLGSEKEALALGLRDILKDAHSVVVIEWADRITKAIPKDAIWIKLSHAKNGEERNIKILGGVKN